MTQEKLQKLANQIKEKRNGMLGVDIVSTDGSVRMKIGKERSGTFIGTGFHNNAPFRYTGDSIYQILNFTQLMKKCELRLKCETKP